MEIEANRVSPIEQYYPIALIDEDGKVILSAQFINGCECLFGDEWMVAMFRRCKRNKQMANCQDYGLISAKKNGDRKIVIADGVSSAVCAQSVANIMTHKIMDSLKHYDGKEIDKDAVFRILEDGNLDLACMFLAEEFAVELEECVKLGLHKKSYVDNAGHGHVGSATLSFMRLEGENLDIGMYGTGGYLIFRENKLIERYGNKEKRPAQIGINRGITSKDIHLNSVKVQKGDVAILFTDGLFGLGDTDIQNFIDKILKHLDSDKTIHRSIYLAFNEVDASDDKTLSILQV